MEWQRYEYRVSTDPALLQPEVIHAVLRQSYWAHDIPAELLRRAVENSLCFGLYRGEQQIGLARLITDYATFAYVSDVFVLAEYQGQGLGQWLMGCVLAHPDLQGLRRILLSTLDAHALYRKLGFSELKYPERMLEIFHEEIYRDTANRLD